MSEYYIVAVPDGAQEGDTVTTVCRLVRCRDCKHYHPELYLHIKCEYHCLNVEPDDFCSYGERRPG